ncbi:YgjP-like metallopeptidase domain-containing protein [Streptomyces acidiscabies]|uniref:DUF45 domain-containing protein n=1 Tax=Streptomyces acidiscabies TaxID=42234 RepID=A0ABU4MC20_9ACTN|nr:YgjP-like metallopeptidase domain-containing protein [Streptomyces acidiscabies]MDX3025654.1 DUF45 domain-containing protein [Streptomyces acidiscabies]
MTTAEDIRAALDAMPRLGDSVATIKISNRRKTVGMSVQPGENGITLHVPAASHPAEIVAVLTKNLHRIGSMLLKARQRAPEDSTKALANGTGFLWLGQPNRLRLVDNPPAAVRHVDDYGAESEPGTWCGRWLEFDRAALRHGAKPLIDWYIRQGDIWLSRQAQPLWLRMTGGRRPMPAVRAAAIGRTRWGVHTAQPDPADDTIRIAWQTFQMRSAIVQHVLTHELVHATRPDGRLHGPEFWRTFERAETGALQTSKELDRVGRTVWMGDIHTPALPPAW